MLNYFHLADKTATFPFSISFWFNRIERQAGARVDAAFNWFENLVTFNRSKFESIPETLGTFRLCLPD